MPDATVLEAAYRVITRLGPRQFTLADIAQEAGLAPATLIQRFKSKRGLLLALSELAAQGAEGCFARVRAEHRSPIKALFASFDEMAQMASSPEALANHLAFLQIDLSDPEFLRWARISAQKMTAATRALLDDAIRAREFTRCNTAALARLIQAATHGSMVMWGFHQEGSARDWLRRDMTMLLRPYRVRKA